MTDNATYTPPKIWKWDAPNGGKFEKINRPTAGATHDQPLPRGKHALQLYSLATPNGVKVTVMLEELLALRSMLCRDGGLPASCPPATNHERNGLRGPASDPPVPDGTLR